MKNIYGKLNRDKDAIKATVKEHWEKEPCELRAGESLDDDICLFKEIDDYRYERAPYIFEFARFEEGRNKRVLEVGLGSCSDFINWARNGANLWGIDITEASVKLAKKRLELEKLDAIAKVEDVETLTFDDNFFDIVYSYGVVHHTPDTPQAIREIYRVLMRGGVARVMIYHKAGLSWIYEWILFGLLRGKPWKSRREIVFYHNESLGTKIYTKAEAEELFRDFKKVNINTVVSAADVMDIQLSDRYQKIWLFRNIQRFLGFLKYFRPFIPSSLGSYMLVEGEK